MQVPLISKPQAENWNEFSPHLNNYCIIKLLGVLRWPLHAWGQDIIWLPGLFCASHALMNFNELHELFLQHHILALNLSNEFMLQEIWHRGTFFIIFSQAPALAKKNMQLLGKLDKSWFIFLQTAVTRENGAPHNRSVRATSQKLSHRDAVTPRCDTMAVCAGAHLRDADFRLNMASPGAQQALPHSGNPARPPLQSLLHTSVAKDKQWSHYHFNAYLKWKQTFQLLFISAFKGFSMDLFLFTWWNC